MARMGGPKKTKSTRPSWLIESRKPTQAQIKRSQTTINAYMAKTGKTFNDTAKSLGISPKKLDKYMFGGQKNIRRAYNAYIDIYDQTKDGLFQGVKVPKLLTEMVQRKGVPTRYTHVGGRYEKIYSYRQGGKRTEDNPQGLIESVTRVYHAPRKPVSPEIQRRTSIFQQSIEQGIKTPSTEAAIQWQTFTSQQNVPASLEELRAAYEDGSISKSKIQKIVDFWQETYDSTFVDYDWFEGN